MTRDEMNLLIPKYEELIIDCRNDYGNEEKIIAYEQFIDFIQDENEPFSEDDTEEELWEHFLEVAAEFGNCHKVKFPKVIDYEAIFSYNPGDEEVRKRRNELIEIIKRELRPAKQGRDGDGSIDFAEFLADRIDFFQSEKVNEVALWDYYIQCKEYEEDKDLEDEECDTRNNRNAMFPEGDDDDSITDWMTKD